MEDHNKDSSETQPDTPEPEAPVADEPAAENEKDNKRQAHPNSHSRWRHLHRFKAWYGSHKKYAIPLTVIVLLAIVAGVPFTRYQAAGLVLKKNFTLEVTDSTANTPVSGAVVSLGGVSGTTDGNGKVTLKSVKVGSHKVSIIKKYYKSSNDGLLVPILKQKTTPDIFLVATGRQVKIKLTNLINAKVLDGAQIEIAGTTAKTGVDGAATVVLPASSTSEKATLSADGYNKAGVTVKINDKGIAENDFKLTPAGKIYFLSKLSGTIDVVKTNLDGTDRQTVLAGTGNEDDEGTVLLASRDWHYLALLSQRAGGSSPSLYLIDTTNDQTKDIDDGNATFNLVGWSGDYFVYTVTRNNVQQWQPHGQALKSYNATSGQLLTLDQTGGDGTNQYDFRQEVYGGVYSLGNTVVYTKQWNYNIYNSSITEKTAGIYSINADGTNAQTLKSVAYSASQGPANIDSFVSSASEIYYAVTENGATSYYSYSDGKLSSDDTVSTDFTTYKPQLTYLLSPSGNNTFWVEPRDGKNTMFVGDEDGGSAKQIATLSDYSAYGWYTDDYLLVSKDASELYIIPVSGIKDDSQAIKVTDYHKPAQNYYGYGGGYGGL